MRCLRSDANRITCLPAGAGDLAVERTAMLMPLPIAGRVTRRLGLLSAACLVVGALSACDDGSPTTPGPRPLAIDGTWTGAMTDRAAGAGVLVVTLAGTSEVGTGTFTLTLADASATVQGAVLARAASAPRIELTLNVTSASRDCPGVPGVFYTVDATLGTNRMTGSFEPAIGCPLLRGGTLELTRR
jgi:hypothetical protein